MAKLLIVSNRLPVRVEKRKGVLHFLPTTGGLAIGLKAFYRSFECIWVGWPEIGLEKITQKESKDIEEKLKKDFDCHPVFLPPGEIEMYYHGFCNRTIWPLFHYFPQYAVYENPLWESYKRANRLFCDEIIKLLQPEDTVWVQDYHLMLLPKFIRERVPNLTMGFFLHIPFPSFEIFRLLPWRDEILEGLLNADLVGFHAYDYVRHFLTSVHRLLGYEHTFGQITAGNRIVKTDPFPMGIDYGRFFDAEKDPEVQREVVKFRKKLNKRKTILSIDRLDYTKGILQRLEAFDLFLEKNSGYKEKTTLILVTVPSRTKVEHYRILKRQVDELIGRINGKHGTVGWVPIWYLYRFLPFSTLAALYRISDIALITPIRDGMNLIAKEYIASKRDGKGVLILSEMAGASKELGEAIIVNPNNKQEIADALRKSLEISEDEQKKRNMIMQERIQHYDIVRWAKEFMERLYETKKVQKDMGARRLPLPMRRRLLHDYRGSVHRLILLDYDGTLIPFAPTPQEARPTVEILRLVEKLAKDEKNQVLLISGRDKTTLEKWFGKLDLGLIAEHGARLKEKDHPWQTIEPLTTDWKEETRPILQVYVDRTPGSLIEEKEFSLTWHYRKADPDLGFIRAHELVDNVANLTARLNLHIVEGNKAIEIKNAGINKGRAALKWISKRKWDFILALGDDRTDEDTFAVLPEIAYSIKVGLAASQARFNLDRTQDVTELLKELVES